MPSTSHRWFRSGSYSLLGHIDVPSASHGRLGVVIVPPFGWEDVCAYRSLRQLGLLFAARGVPVIRFDLPGTGDSSGGAADAGLWQAWTQSVADAAAELQAATGVERVAVVGVRLGAILALAAVAGIANLQTLVLWGGYAKGRDLLREFRAFRALERRQEETVAGEDLSAENTPPLEVFGFLLHPETERALEAFDLRLLSNLLGKRVLVLSCDDLPADAKLLAALETLQATVNCRAGVGYSAMMAPPHESVVPEETWRTVLEFVKEQPAHETEMAPRAAAQDVSTAHPAIRESICVFEHRSGPLFGVLTEPSMVNCSSQVFLLFLNGGAVRHIGSNRMWVDIARRWAERGLPSFRLDFAGLGESGGECALDVPSLYQGPVLEQIDHVCRCLRTRLGIRDFVVVGLCSGAFWGFQTAIRQPDVRGALLLNPRLFFWDPEVDRRRTLRDVSAGWTSASRWQRLALGEIKPERIKKAARAMLGELRHPLASQSRDWQIPAQAMVNAMAAINKNGTRLTFIFTEGEPLLAEMEEEGHLPPADHPLIRCNRIANAEHTFHPLWAQKLVHKMIDDHIEAVARDVAQESRQAAATASLA